MLVTALPQVMRSHLQFGAVLDNAVIRLEMQKSSLKLNNIFVTVLRGADCLEPCWSLDLEYFGVVLIVESAKITLEHPAGGFMVGGFSTRLRALAFPGRIVWHRLVFAALAPWGRAPGSWMGRGIRPRGLQAGGRGRSGRMPSGAAVPAWLRTRHGSAPLSPTPLSVSCLAVGIPSLVRWEGACPSSWERALPFAVRCAELPGLPAVWGNFSSCCLLVVLRQAATNCPRLSRAVSEGRLRAPGGAEREELALDPAAPDPDPPEIPVCDGE